MKRISDAKNTIVGSYSRARELPHKTIKKIENTINIGKTSWDSIISNGKIWIYKTTIITLTASILLYAAIFMYASFYFAFIPVVAHEAPLHLGFESCFETPEKCGYINASLPLNMLSGSGNQGSEGNSPVLMSGLPYTVVVALNMPESPRNLELGMFMSCLQVLSTNPQKSNKDGKLGMEDGIIRSTCKSSMIQYRSILLRNIETLTFAPFYMSGHLVEKQNVYIEFFDDFTDVPLNPAMKMDFELQSRFAEVYDARLIIHAKFLGLRYFMYYYPATSAIVGTLFNFHVLALVVLLSWMRFFAPSKYTEERNDEESEDEELNESVMCDIENIHENGKKEKDGYERKLSSDLEVINNDSAFQVDPQEDSFPKKFIIQENCNEDKKTI